MNDLFKDFKIHPTKLRGENMSICESSITNPKKQLEFYKQLSEQLQQENKILKENAEHNDKVVDKVNWENNLLKQQNKKYKEVIDKAINILCEIDSCNMKKQYRQANLSVLKLKDILKEVE